MTKHMIFQVGMAPIKGKEDQLHTIMFREDQGELLPFRAYFDFQQGCWIQTKSGNKVETGEGVPKLFYLNNATPMGDASKEYGIVPLSQAPKTDSEVFKAFVIKVNPEGKIDGMFGTFKNKKWYDKEDNALQDRETLEYVCPIEWVEEDKKAVEKEQIERILSDKPFEAPKTPFTEGSEPKVDWIKEAGETPAAEACLEGVEMSVIPKGIEGDSFKYPVVEQEEVSTAKAKFKESFKEKLAESQKTEGMPIEEKVMEPFTDEFKTNLEGSNETLGSVHISNVVASMATSPKTAIGSTLSEIPLGVELNLTRFTGKKNMPSVIMIHDLLPTGNFLYTIAGKGLEANIANPYTDRWTLKFNDQVIFSYE